MTVYFNIAHLECLTSFANPMWISYCYFVLPVCPFCLIVAHVSSYDAHCCHVSSNLIDGSFWIVAVVSSYLITGFCLDCCNSDGHVTYEDGRLCGPGGSDMATVAFHTYSGLKDSIGQVLHSILIAEQVSVCTGFPFHCYDGTHWLGVQGFCFLAYETCCRIRDGTGDTERKFNLNSPCISVISSKSPTNAQNRQ